jgi:hypothetical protein
MNTFGEWYNPLTWFDGSTDTATNTATETGSSDIGNASDPFGWSSWFSGGSTDIQAGVSDSQLNDWNSYWASGGVMGADLSNPASNTGGSSFDFLGGVNDFLAGITGVAQTGLGIWQGVQTIINEQNPTDELVRLPGSNTPVVKRTTGGNTQYYPITELYPNLSGQVKTAQNSWIGPALIAGVLGIGLIVILKKK